MGIEYDEIIDLPSLNSYFLAEFEKIGDSEFLPPRLLEKLLEEIGKQYIRSLISLPENAKMTRKERRELFRQNKERRFILAEMLENEPGTVAEGNKEKPEKQTEKAEPSKENMAKIGAANKESAAKQPESAEQVGGGHNENGKNKQAD